MRSSRTVLHLSEDMALNPLAMATNAAAMVTVVRIDRTRTPMEVRGVAMEAIAILQLLLTQA
jgi:hypothetical protein